MQRLLLLTCFLQATNLYCAFWTTRNIDIQDRLEAEPSINAMSGLGMRTRPHNQLVHLECHAPALSDIAFLANAALQVRGKENNCEFPVAQQRARAYRNFGDPARHIECVPIWALNPAFAVKHPRSPPVSSPDEKK